MREVLGYIGWWLFLTVCLAVGEIWRTGATNWWFDAFMAAGLVAALGWYQATSAKMIELERRVRQLEREMEFTTQLAQRRASREFWSDANRQ